MQSTADDLYTKVWPDYFEIQRKDLWYYERLWNVLLRQLKKRSFGERLIEFGSGPGFLLRLAGEEGWQAEGFEPSMVARKHAASLGVRSSPLKPEMWGLYHAAIATEVLEHLTHPVSTLMEWRGALLRGGVIAISVPNDNNPLQRLFWGKKKPWIHGTHLQYFNPKSLRRAVRAAGFEVVWQRTSFPVELLLVLPIPRKWAWKLSRLWPAPPLLWRFGIGRHCLLVAQKI